MRTLLYEREKVLLHTLIYSLECKSCLEIGSWEGGSATIIFEAMELNGFGKLVCLDPNHRASQQRREKLKNRVTFLQGRSPENLPDAAKLGAPFDFVFIDGDHSYEAVLNDCNAVEPHLDNEAHLLFHDILMPSVGRAVETWMKGNGSVRSMMILHKPTCHNNGMALVYYERKDKAPQPPLLL